MLLLSVWLVASAWFLSVPCQCRTYFLDQARGNDRNDGTQASKAFGSAGRALGALAPGDTLLIVGQLANPSYKPNYSFKDEADPHVWMKESTLKLDEIRGTRNKWITISSYDSSTILKGDGANIVRLTSCAYIALKNLRIEGEVQRIPYSTARKLQFLYKDKSGAIQHRVDPSLSDKQIEKKTLKSIGKVDRPSYTDTRGMYVSDSHHILVQDNLILNMPGGGFRVSKSEYVDVIGNEIANTSRKSFSGTHGLVVTYTKDLLPQETPGNYRVRVLRNIVHHNYNEIYSWDGNKVQIKSSIDEGKGISLQRNQDFVNGGRILIANNIAYWNGYSGVHSNDGDNIDMIANTAYMNSYTQSVTYADKEEKSGHNVGLSLSNGDGCKIINNIIVVENRFPKLKGYPISVTADTTRTLKVDSNVIYGYAGKTVPQDADLDTKGVKRNMINGDPLFKSKVSAEDSSTGRARAFTVHKQSVAVGHALLEYLPCEDAFGYERTTETIGAVGFGTQAAIRAQGIGEYLRSLGRCYTFGSGRPPLSKQGSTTTNTMPTVGRAPSKKLTSLTPRPTTTTSKPLAKPTKRAAASDCHDPPSTSFQCRYIDYVQDCYLQANQGNIPRFLKKGFSTPNHVVKYCVPSNQKSKFVGKSRVKVWSTAPCNWNARLAEQKAPKQCAVAYSFANGASKQTLGTVGSAALVIALLVCSGCCVVGIWLRKSWAKFDNTAATERTPLKRPDMNQISFG